MNPSPDHVWHSEAALCFPTNAGLPLHLDGIKINIYVDLARMSKVLIKMVSISQVEAMFCFPINELYDIGPEILCETYFGHNSTQIEALVT